MEDVIKKIIYIENKAQKVIVSAEKEKEDKYKALEERLVALEEKLMGDANRKVAKLREMELSDAKEKAESMYEDCTGRIKMVEQFYKDREQEWCSYLYNKVLERD